MFFNTMHGTLSTFLKRFCHTQYRKKPKYGSRYLTEPKNVFDFNAWDDVEWSEEQEKEAQRCVQANSTLQINEEIAENYKNKADTFWDAFYDIHSNRFFKDRHWLFTEFPELIDSKNKQIFEIGCGVGNTICPILQNDPNVTIFGCDFSPKAIEILNESTKVDSSRCKVFVMDATETEWKVPFEPCSIDIIVMIFVLSAIEPKKYLNVIRNINKYLKSGGLVLFRDYGQYDLAQLRFKPGRSLEENFYVRGDGTCVYFFKQDELRHIFTSNGFAEIENRVDKRLQVNRGKQLKMYRVWIQAKFEKT